MTKPVFIIAEAGVNHNGSLDLALRLVDAAKDAGVDAIKFQTFLTEKIMTRKVAMADYQKENLGGAGSQFDMVKSLELTYADFRLIKKYCEKVGIQFLSTPDEEESLDFLVDELDIPWIKVGSGELDNLPYLRRIAAKRRPTILSTGMSTLGEVEQAVNLLRAGGCPELVVLHCTTNYPCPMDEVNLFAMLTLREGLKVRIGYSDHTLGAEVIIAAVALGAEVVEKHFTLDPAMEGPDHKASMTPAELKDLVVSIRRVEKALGDGVKRPNHSEEVTKRLVRRRLVAACALPEGAVLQETDVSLKRADDGLTADYLELVLGHRLKVPLRQDQSLTLGHFEF